MDQKSFAEGARAFTLWGATLIDAAHRSGDAAADGLVSLLTPVIKGFLTDQGYDMTIKAQQVYGGHGYIEEWGMSQFTRDEASDADFLEPLKTASKDLQAAGMYFMQNGMKNPNNALSGSYDFMHMFGHVCLGLMWAKMGKAARDALATGASDTAFYETKLHTGRYYMARQLPATALHLNRIQSGADTVMALDVANF